MDKGRFPSRCWWRSKLITVNRPTRRLRLSEEVAVSTVSEAVGLGPEVADQVKQPEAMEVRLLEDSTA